MKRILFIIFLILFVSCDKSPQAGSFISSYLEPGQGLKCVYDSKSDIININSWDSPEIREGYWFDHYSTYYNDNHYYGYKQPRIAIATEFTVIDIVCDVDFDETHPSGTSLRDIVRFNGISYYPYIKNNYKGIEYTHIDKLLAELLPSDLILLEPRSVSLKFTKPRPAGEQTYNITFKTKDKELVTTIKFDN